MAKDPHEAVDFSPAWLNFNNSNKKKSSEKSSVSHLSSPSSITSSSKASQESVYRTNSLNPRPSGSPSRSWGQQISSLRPLARHQSVDYSLSHQDNKNDHSSQSPNRDHKSLYPRSGPFSPTLPPSKKIFSANPWARNVSSTSSGIDTDFPSLSDVEVSDQKKSSNPASPGRSNPNTVVNMWQKPLILKSKVSNASPSSPNSKQTSTTASIYKTLVPKAATTHQKQPYRRTMSVPLNLPSKSADYIGDFITNGSKRELSTLTKSSNQSPTTTTSPQQPPRQEVQQITTKTSAVDIAVVSGRKKHRKGKNHFLKALRQTDDETENSAGRTSSQPKSGDNATSTNIEEKTQSPAIMEHSNESNGKQIHTVTQHDDFVLSSSLEAEHRLLREMGWKNSDEQTMEEEEAPLTEDEIKEFKLRCNGIISTPAVKREKDLQNAFSGWKFSGIRKRGTNADIENNNNASFLFILEENGFDNENISDNEF